jgi:hypothetical protein
MKNFSRFDLGMIIAFVIVALFGGGAWYWLSGQLATAQSDASAAAGEFDQYTKKEVYLPTGGNVKMLQADIGLMTAQLDPLVKNELQSPGNLLPAIEQTDTVKWKHLLDDEVKALNDEARISGIKVPDNFYYGFSRYLNTNPTQDATPVLSRQLLGVKTIVDILIKAPVQAIVSVKRTYEEDPEGTGGGRGYQSSPNQQNASQLSGHSQEASGGVYTAYPFEVEFDAKTESFRKIVNDLMKSPYVFVIRSILVQNSRLDSPNDPATLDTMAGPAAAAPDPSIINSSPGAVAAAQPTVGVQYLFGNETLHIRLRVDLIDWHGVATATNAPTHSGRNGGGPGGGGAGSRSRPAREGNQGGD